MLALHDPDCLLHKTVELIGAKAIQALESPARLQSIVDALKSSPHDLRTVEYTSLSDVEKETLFKTVASTHDAGYLKHIENVFSDWRNKELVDDDGCVLPECFRFPTSIKNYNVDPKPPKDVYARHGFYSFDMSSGVSKSTWKSTIASANLGHQGTKLLFPSSSSSTSTSHHSSSPNTVLALCRPPGHHCDGSHAGGYCYINNVAVAVSTCQAWLRSSSSPSSTTNPRIAILDLDFHHGNGTQELYYSSSQVQYISIHGEDEFPYYTGHASETGLGDGEGYNLNLPLPSNSSFEAYLEKLEIAMQRLVEFDPGFVLVSLGFDTFHLDPLGKFGIETGDYGVMAARVARGVKALGSGAEVKTLVVLEGGYVVEKLGENMLSWLRGWEVERGSGERAVTPE